jgi:hypothetical protein
VEQNNRFDSVFLFNLIQGYFWLHLLFSEAYERWINTESQAMKYPCSIPQHSSVSSRNSSIRFSCRFVAAEVNQNPYIDHYWIA